MYDKYKTVPPEYIPNNEVLEEEAELVYEGVITRGQHCTNTFEIPLALSEIVRQVTVHYTQGIDMALDIKTAKVEVLPGKKAFVIVKLTPEDTTLFDTAHGRDTQAQIQFVLETGKVTYSEIYKIKVLPSLIPDLVYFNLDIEEPENGRIVGAAPGKYLEGEEITLTAIPDENFEVNGWYQDGEFVSSFESYTFIIEADTSISALFEVLAPTPYMVFDFSLTGKNNSTAVDLIAIKNCILTAREPLSLLDIENTDNKVYGGEDSIKGGAGKAKGILNFMFKKAVKRVIFTAKKHAETDASTLLINEQEIDLSVDFDTYEIEFSPASSLQFASAEINSNRWYISSMEVYTN